MERQWSERVASGSAIGSSTAGDGERGTAGRMGSAARVPDPAPPDGGAHDQSGAAGSSHGAATGPRPMARVQVLRLLETFELSDLHVAIKNARHLGAIHWPFSGM